MYADNSDLEDYVSDIFSHGAPSFASELTLASADLLNKVKAEWWPSASQARTAYENTLSPITLDEAYLNTAALKQATIFRALSAYIFPKLSKNVGSADGDVFSAKAEFYRKMYKEEWDTAKMLPLYDFDHDTQFEDIERRGPIPRRVIRG
jgi:hypothetical protein